MRILYRWIRRLTKRRRDRNVTKRLNEIYSRTPAQVDSLLSLAQFEALKHDPWQMNSSDDPMPPVTR